MSVSRDKSEAVFQRMQEVLPGGVNSPVRAFRAVGGVPHVLERGEGAYVWDIDGHRYVDFMGSWGPLILGHAHPEVLETVVASARRGLTFGAPCEAEVELAERVVNAYPGLEQVRCVSSGTEAVMSAIRLARGVTGRDVVLKFSGCYHGHVDHLLVAAGSGLVTFGEPSSAGVPEAFASLTATQPLDDLNAVESLFEKEGGRIAAVILEPIPANNGLLLQRREFLQGLREITEKHGALLIFDEVISGFRVARGGAAEHYGITPDIATFGKVIGGGMPVGAFDARREIMNHLAPLGKVYQAGTLSGNPVAMSAGAKTLEILDRDEAWARLEALGARLEERLAPALAERDASLVRVGSIFWMSLQPGEAPRTAECIAPAAAERYGKLFHALREEGLNIAPSAYEVGFLSTAHEESHVDALAEAVARRLG